MCRGEDRRGGWLVCACGELAADIYGSHGLEGIEGGWRPLEKKMARYED